MHICKVETVSMLLRSSCHSISVTLPWLYVCHGNKIFGLEDHWFFFGGHCGVGVNYFYTGSWVELLGGGGTLLE